MILQRTLDTLADIIRAGVAFLWRIGWGARIERL